MTIKLGKILAVTTAVGGVAAYLLSAKEVRKRAKDPEHPGYWNACAQHAVGRLASVPFIYAALQLWEDDSMDIQFPRRNNPVEIGDTHDKAVDDGSDEAASTVDKHVPDTNWTLAELMSEIRSDVNPAKIVGILLTLRAKHQSDDVDGISDEDLYSAINKAYMENPKSVEMLEKYYPSIAEDIYEICRYYAESHKLADGGDADTALTFALYVRSVISSIKSGDSTCPKKEFKALTDTAINLGIGIERYAYARDKISNAFAEMANKVK